MEDLYQQVTRFVTNNQLLEQLNARLNEFNPFKVLRVSQHEIRHSNMLGWLLNPQENHQLGDIFLKKMLAEVLYGEIQVQNHQLQITDIMLGTLYDAEVLREWRNIDLLIFSKANSLVILIENKVYAGLADHQLSKYITTVKQRYPNVKNVVPIYLTINGDEAPHREYYSFSHRSILDILNSIIYLHKEHMNNQVADFIRFYIQTLEALTMQDEKLVQLCREIYKHHKEAIEAIIEYGTISTSSLNQAFELLENELNCISHNEDSKFFLSDKERWFLPKELQLQIPSLSRKWKSPKALSYFFAAEEKRLLLILELGPISDIQKRSEILSNILENNKKQFFSRKSNSSSYTRIRSKSIEIDDWSDTEHVSGQMKILLEQKFQYAEVNEELKSLLINNNF
ncbi:hypothetical protein D3C75_251190 [compost metagenome]